ncbi:MAG: SCO6745 family protein [Streptosporangiaceae bacterium]
MTDQVIPAEGSAATAEGSAATAKGSAATARRMWTLFEAVHLVTYFSPQARQAYEDAGLRGFWRGYFAGRAAPAGAAGPPVVIATFFSFAPAFVRRAIPSVWELITPEQALRAREAGAVAALRAAFGYAEGTAGGAAGGREVGGGTAGGRGVPDSVIAAADLLLAATRDLDIAGRPLGGPNAALPVPAEPLARLWHAATVLREHRGDGHIGALVAADIGGCEALVLRAAVDEWGEASGTGRSGVTRAQVQQARGWTGEEWDAAAGRLAARGFLDSAGAVTQAGQAVHGAVEAATDVAAARPWEHLGVARVAELTELLEPLAGACAATLPFPNPAGVPRPAGAPRPGEGS